RRAVAVRAPWRVLPSPVLPYAAYDLPLEVIVALAEHPNIIGIKESSGNVEKVAAMVAATRPIKRSTSVTELQQAVTGRMLAAPPAEENGGGLVSVSQLGGKDAGVGERPKIKTRSREVGFQVLVGAAHTLLDSLQAGASGGVLAFAAPAPTICFEIHAAWRDNDMELARSKQSGLAAATKRIVSELGIPA